MNRRQRRQRRSGGGADFLELDVDAQLERLEAQVAAVRAATYEAILGGAVDSAGGDPLDAVATLNGHYEVCSEQVGAQPTDERIKQLDGVGTALQTLVRLAKAHANVRDVDEQLEHGDVAAAASAVAEAGTMLAEAGSASARVLGALHTQLVRARAAVRAEAERMADAMLRIDCASAVRAVEVVFSVGAGFDGAPFDSAATLSDMFFALRELGLARARADALADALAQGWLLPLLHQPHVRVHVARSALGATLSIDTLARADARRPELVSEEIEQLATRWRVVLEFVRDAVFADCADDHADVVDHVARRMWARVRPAVHAELLPRLVPAELDALDAACVAPLHVIEDAWALLLPPEALGLRAAARALLQTFVASRRRDLLAAVAAVVAAGGSNTAEVGGHGPVIDVLAAVGDGKKGKQAHGKGKAGSATDDALHFPRCAVSEQAQTLVDSARQTLALSSGDGGRTAALYFHAVRDAFALYACSMAAAGTEARRVFVAFNDCMYFAHHLSALGLRLRDKWPPALRASATFVDLLALFRARAREALTPLLARTRDNVVRELGGWTRARWLCSDEFVADEAEARLVAACALVGVLAHDADACLPAATAARVLALMADVVAKYVADRLAEADATGDARARALVRLAAPVLALEDRLATPDSKSRRRTPIAKYAREWDRLQTQIRRLSAAGENL
ncbi:ribosome biogenesis protein ytm1 [Coemansia sp. RSA 2611]|nr:ribosome biogenesis protein ytm1 [Coemansia sp. RSA 2611]